MKKNIEIILKPEDFNKTVFLDIENCALAKAIKRKFKKLTDYDIGVGTQTVSIERTEYEIENGFNSEDYEYVKNQYKKDPKMLKARYIINLIPY